MCGKSLPIQRTLRQLTELTKRKNGTKFKASITALLSIVSPERTKNEYAFVNIYRLVVFPRKISLVLVETTNSEIGQMMYSQKYFIV